MSAGGVFHSFSRDVSTGLAEKDSFVYRSEKAVTSLVEIRGLLSCSNIDRYILSKGLDIYDVE